MVNLVRFRGRSRDGTGSGWDVYSRYSRADIPLLKRVGGTIGSADVRSSCRSTRRLICGSTMPARLHDQPREGGWQTARVWVLGGVW